MPRDGGGGSGNVAAAAATGKAVAPESPKSKRAAIAKVLTKMQAAMRNRIFKFLEKRFGASAKSAALVAKAYLRGLRFEQLKQAYYSDLDDRAITVLYHQVGVAAAANEENTTRHQQQQLQQQQHHHHQQQQQHKQPPQQQPPPQQPRYAAAIGQTRQAHHASSSPHQIRTRQQARRNFAAALMKGQQRARPHSSCAGHTRRHSTGSIPSNFATGGSGIGGGTCGGGGGDSLTSAHTDVSITYHGSSNSGNGSNSGNSGNSSTNNNNSTNNPLHTSGEASATASFATTDSGAAPLSSRNNNTQQQAGGRTSSATTGGKHTVWTAIMSYDIEMKRKEDLAKAEARRADLKAYVASATAVVVVVVVGRQQVAHMHPPMYTFLCVRRPGTSSR
jgi:hypothetical protein